MDVRTSVQATLDNLPRSAKTFGRSVRKLGASQTSRTEDAANLVHGINNLPRSAKNFGRSVRKLGANAFDYQFHTG